MAVRSPVQDPRPTPAPEADEVHVGPGRIVCLSAEAADILYRLGCGDRVVGVSGYTRFPPEAREKPFISSFTSFHYDAIEQLEPDLVIAFSDLQAPAAAELGRRGYTVLLTNQRSVEDVLETIGMVGRLVGRIRRAAELVRELRALLDEAGRAHVGRPRPRIYFEEWPDPLVTGIGWVGELIEAAGGEDVFSDLRNHPAAADRSVSSSDVIARSPDVVVASWCGRKVNVDEIRAREGWGELPAVRDGHVYDLDSTFCLQPGPVLFTEGLQRFRRIVTAWHASQRI